MAPVPDRPSRSSKRSRTRDAAADGLTPERQKRLKVSQEENAENADSNTLTPTPDTAPIAAEKAVDETAPQWSLHHVFSGRFGDTEPLLSADENYLFLTLGGTVQVFSMSTQRPVRRLQLKGSAYVTGLRLSPSSPTNLYVLTSAGDLIQWDWESDKEIASWAKFRKVQSFEVVKKGSPKKDEDEEEEEEEERVEIFYLQEKKEGRRAIAVSALEKSSSERPDQTVLLDTARPLTHLRVLSSGRSVVACSSSHLLVGTRNSSDSFEYTWREVQVPVRITALDVRQPTPLAAVDLAIGESNGSILVYQDIVNALSRNEKASDAEKQGLPLLRKLHWHREAVGTLRWTRDGNYIISGGKESVLVFWQLDTGRKNFLPHFPSAIRELVISPTGRLYVCRLADNSTIVLSAAELRPIATINGLQLPSSTPKQGRTAESGAIAGLSVPAIFHPQKPEHLLVAIPARGDDSEDNVSMLQTFNVQTGSHISRQSLTRTNITVLNKGPEGTVITTPNIQHLDISEDGKWLATVERWQPHRADVDALNRTSLHETSNSHGHAEIFLKFWTWNDSTMLWELATRIDTPHFRAAISASGPAEVLCLASRPGRHEFATFGADGVLRIWQVVARYPSSAKKNKQVQRGRMEHTWKCQTVMDLAGNAGLESDTAGALSVASMCYSGDGSVLAICVRDAVHLIDAHRWALHATRSGISSGDAFSVKFLGRFVVVVSKQSITLWDVVDDVVQPISQSQSSPDSGDNDGDDDSAAPNDDNILLAVNPTTDTFAVATQRAAKSNKSNKSKSKAHRKAKTWAVSVYSRLQSSTSGPVFKATLGAAPRALLADPSRGDYVVLDAEANVKRLMSAAAVGAHSEDGVQSVTISADVAEQLQAGLQRMFGSIVAGKSTTTTVNDEDAAHGGSGKSRIDAIFDRVPAYALPPVDALFGDVVKSLVMAS